MALKPGPRVVVLGAVHGNERCGAQAIAQVVDELAAGAFGIERGVLTMVPVTNPYAYQQRTRQVDRNLNRNLRVSAEPVDYEDQIANVLCPLLDAHDVLLDLHSFHTPGQPFTMVAPPTTPAPLSRFSIHRKRSGWSRTLGLGEWWKAGWTCMPAAFSGDSRPNSLPMQVCWTRVMALARPNTCARAVAME